jgi:hypothetical protein
MFGLTLSKILLTVLIIVLVWRGLRLYQQFQSRLTAGNGRRAPAAPRGGAVPEATDLVECPRCGTFVPNGTICRSREECRFRRA